VLLKKGESLYGYLYECSRGGRPNFVQIYAKGKSEDEADKSAAKKIEQKCKRYDLSDPKLMKRAWLE
jgi:hypothetical protein